MALVHWSGFKCGSSSIILELFSYSLFMTDCFLAGDVYLFLLILLLIYFDLLCSQEMQAQNWGIRRLSKECQNIRRLIRLNSDDN